MCFLWRRDLQNRRFIVNTFAMPPLAEHDGVWFLSAVTMEQILHDHMLPLGDDKRFKFICHWLNDRWDVGASRDEKSNRKAAAKSLVAKHVNLEHIARSTLNGTVAASGLESQQH
jgi:hypothetical protein